MGRMPLLGVAGLLVAGMTLTGCCQNGACRNNSTTSDPAKQTAGRSSSTQNPYKDNTLIGSPSETGARTTNATGQAGSMTDLNGSQIGNTTQAPRNPYATVPQNNTTSMGTSAPYGMPSSFNRGTDNLNANSRFVEERQPPITPPGPPAGMSLPPGAGYGSSAASGLQRTSYEQQAPVNPPPPTPPSDTMRGLSQSNFQGYPAPRGVPTSTPGVPTGMGGLEQ